MSEEYNKGYAQAKKELREAFLNFMADAQDWDIEYDGDMSDSGRMIDCSTYHIHGDLSGLRDFCEELGIEPKYEQSLDDAIQKAIEGEFEKVR